LIYWKLEFVVFSYLVLLVKWHGSPILQANTSWYRFFLFYFLKKYWASWFSFLSFLSGYLNLMTWPVSLVGRPIWTRAFVRLKIAFFFNFFVWLILLFNFILQYLIGWKLSFVFFFKFGDFSQTTLVTGFVT
jgi:hypothetical protein